ncbi:MAG TPA: acyltransferase [Candidatus Babeliaceae bacterium]|nr:acyltransferase [Candidatus Babeliaceae bacterium]
MRLYSIPLVRQNRLKYIPSLDGLRGIAVISVILYHCFPFLVVTKIGWIGVDLFFVLSGFLITGILYDTKSTPKYYVNFILRRVLRIFPLYYFVLLLIFFVLPFFPSLVNWDFVYYRTHQAYFWSYMQNWLYSRDGFPKNHMLIHFWSLAVEEQFYIFWPWIVKLSPAKHLLKVTVILILVSVLFRLDLGFHFGYSIVYQYMATLSRMDALLIGAAIAILIRNKPIWLEKATVPILFVSFFVVAGTIVITGKVGFLSLPTIYTFIDLVCGCLLVFCLSSQQVPILTGLVSNRILRWMGKYSYGLYVYHYIIFNILEFKMRPFLSVTMGNEFFIGLIIGVFTLCLSLIVSYLSFRYLESPFLTLKKFFEYKVLETRNLHKLPSVLN